MAFRKRTNAYWEKRAQEQLTLIETQALPYLKEIDKAYLTARRYNLQEIKKLYETYYSKQGFDIQALQQLAPQGDVRRFKEAIEELGLSSRLPDGYGFRLSRLELLDSQMWLEAHKAGATQLSLQTAAHKQAIETSYNYSLYTLSKGTGVVPVFSQLNTREVNQILNSKFYGKNYSDRVWKNTGALAKELKNTLASSVASGQSYTKTARDIRERYDVTRYQATRLVQTETARFNTLATDKSYKEIDIEEWVYIATLDSSTSDTCAHHDGKRFPVGGGVFIPVHPGCRCTKRAYLGKEYEPDERIMRDPETGKNRYVGNISYNQWSNMVGNKVTPIVKKVSSNLTPQALKVREVENSIRSLPREKFYAVDPNGNVLAEIGGTTNRVTIPGKTVELLKESKDHIFTHNHPGAKTPNENTFSFSLADLKTASLMNSKELRAVGKTHDYSMKRVGDAWPNQRQITIAYNKAAKEAKIEVDAMLYNKSIERVDANFYYYDKISDKVAAKFNLLYKKEEVL